MNNNVKEVLIDLIDYWNTMGTESDPGIEAFCSVVQRASRELELESKKNRKKRTKNTSISIDPFEVPQP
jgi:hypothetical protein